MVARLMSNHQNGLLLTIQQRNKMKNQEQQEKLLDKASKAYNEKRHLFKNADEGITYIMYLHDTIVLGNQESIYHVPEHLK